MAIVSRKVTGCFLLLLAALVAAAAPRTAAAEPGEGKVSIAHTPPKGDTLPFPGNMISLRVSLKNTRDSDRKLRAFFTLDGRLQQMDLEGARFSEAEEPSYQFDLPAPVAHASYQFVLYNPDQSFVVSPRYVIKRSCTPDISLASEGVDAKLKGDEKMLALVNTSKGLERDIETYEHVLALLDEVKGLLGQD